MTRDEAYKLVTSWTSNKNLVKHMLAVEAAMKALAKYFGEDEKEWGLVGLIHDMDYEKYPDVHPQKLIEYLEKNNEDKKIVNAVKAHAYGYNGFDYEPKTKMDWNLYCCDELTGFIVAVTLIRPEKKLSFVTVENILSKWAKKDFAKGVNRKQVEMCNEKLGIPLPEFIKIILSSMTKIDKELGL